MKLSMQTYTVQKAYESDPWGTLEFLRGLGLNFVEIGGTSGIPAPEFKKKLDAVGLRVSGNHVSVQRLDAQFNDVVEENLTLENPYVTISSVDRSLYEQGWTKVASTLDAYGARLAEKGLVLSYHNHAFEFALENGKPGLHVLYETADPGLVKAQIDTYWIAYGGADPA